MRAHYLVPVAAWALLAVSATALAQTPDADLSDAQPIIGATVDGLTLPAMQTRNPDEATPVDSAPANSEPVTQTPARSQKQSATPALPTQQTLVLIPGVNQVIPVARGHLNRIVTPFTEPVVHTTSTAKISTEGNVLYVASTAKGPTTLYVSPDGDQDMALSLTLLPQPIPPREIRIRLAKQAGVAATNRHAAGQWERERPYVTTIKKALRKLALGEVPQGFGLGEWHSGDPMIACAQASLAIEQGQVLTGNQTLLLVGKATNISDERVEIQEPRCRQTHVMAVAAWPQASLEPGQSTEIYVVMRRPDPEKEARARPSLLNKGGEK